MAANAPLQTLFEKYMNNTCTKEEWNELLQLVREETHEEDLRLAFQSYWNSLPTMTSDSEYWNDKFFSMMQEAKEVTGPAVVGDRPQADVVPLYKRKAFRWIAAAVIIGIIATVAVLSLPTKDQTKPTATTHDVPAPTETRAVIILANGSKVYLDSLGNGVIAQENSVAVIKNSEGGIEYRGQKSEVGGQVAYNTLSNPRGSKVISLTLSDGTRVWLNSESSLRYPASFATSAFREVEITGEAYFEVKHNTKQPFKVHLPNGSIVEDLGTAFNINAYPDENTTKTTLVEGSIKITSSLRVFVAKPKAGEQVIEKPNSQPTTDHSPDLESVLSWKNGQFSYTNSDLETIMRQMARWYDVEVIYKDKITDRYTVDVPRTVPVSQLFKFIEMSGGVHFKIEGKKITVSK